MARRAPLVVAVLVGIALVVPAVALRPSPLAAQPRAEAYRVTYRIEDRATSDISVRTETLDVRRPYDGRLEAKDADGERTSGRVTNREFRWELETGDKQRFGVRRAPGGPVREVSFTALVDAARAGVIARLGTGEAVGRPCAWFVFANPQPELLAPATATDRVEACVDPAGILLREIWRLDGRVVRSVEATRVDLRAFDDDDFLYGIDPDKVAVTDDDVAELLRSQSVVADDVPTPKAPLVISPPRGWKADRRSVVVAGAVGGSRPGQYASDCFVRGPELVVVERALRPGEEPVWPLGEGDPYDAGIGTGRLLWYGDHVELRITVDDGYARIFAPSVMVARAFASRLRAAD